MIGLDTDTEEASGQDEYIGHKLVTVRLLNVQQFELQELKVQSHRARVLHVKKYIEEKIGASISITDEIKRDTYSFSIIHHKSSENESGWQNFIPREISDDIDLSNSNVYIYIFVRFGTRCFVVAGGRAPGLVTRFCQGGFGLSYLGCLDYTDNDVIHSIERLPVTGDIAIQKTGFVSGKFINSTRRVSQVPIRIKLEPSEELKDSVFPSLERVRDKKLKIEGSDYLSFSHPIVFDELCDLCSDIDNSYILRPYDSFSSLKKVYNQDEIKALDDIKISYLFNFFQRDDSYTRLTFLHPSQPMEFLASEKYLCISTKDSVEFEFTSHKDILTSVLSFIFEVYSSADDFFEFRGRISSYVIKAIKADKVICSAPLIKCVQCELSKAVSGFKGASAFYIAGRWYLANENYSAELIDHTINLARSNQAIFLRGKLLKWESEDDEGTYNASHANEDNFLVLDKITPLNIELCDLLYILDGTLYLIHVKRGFDSAMRRLDIASKACTEDS